MPSGAETSARIADAVMSAAIRSDSGTKREPPESIHAKDVLAMKVTDNHPTGADVPQNRSPTLRERWNALLCRLGVRQVLPAYYVNRLGVKECGEGLVEWQGVWVREGVAKRLARAGELLPPGFSIQVRSGFRDEAEQRQLQEEARRAAPRAGEADLARRIARQSGHQTGGAVDVVLRRDGQVADCGSEYLGFTPTTASHARGLTSSQRRNRQILFAAMRGTGFVNYPFEWWHWAYGDRLWAAYGRHPAAIYGPIGGRRKMKCCEITGEGT